MPENWKIINEIGKFIENEIFVNQHSKTVDGEKLIEIMVEIFRNIFTKLITIKTEDDTIMDKEIEKLILFSPKIISALKLTELNFIKANPKVLINTESYLFELIQILGKTVKNNDILISILNYMISFISFDLKEPHTEILCKRSLECIESIFNSNEHIHDISNEDMAKIILNIVNSIIQIFKKRNDNEILSHVIKYHKKEDKYIFNFLIDKLLETIFSKIFFDIKDQIILDKLIILFNEILNKENENKNINKEYQNELNQINEDLEITVINFIINDLFLKSFFINEELKNKILSIIICDKLEVNANNKIIYNSFCIDNFNIKSLFEICKIKSKEEIKKDFDEIINNHKNSINIANNVNYVENYFDIRINLVKKSIPLLIEKSKKAMKKYLNQIKNNEIISENEEEKIKNILVGLKELNYISNEYDEKFYENHIMKECLKSKKGHLFILHFILSEFIQITKNNDIINIIKDIFKIISEELGLKTNE